MKSVRAIAVVLATALPGVAQVAFPQDSPATEIGNSGPLGYSTTPGADECRYQLLIPARYLPPTGGLITGLEVALSRGQTQVTLASLDITLSRIQATRLDGTFANNLPNPLGCFSGSNVSLQFTLNDWSPVTFSQPFPYDGTSDLVIEFRKVYDRVAHPPSVPLCSHVTSSSPGRWDVPNARYEFGAPGSGASTAATARVGAPPLRVRLDFAPLPTLRIRSDRSNLGRNVFAIGESMDLTVTGPQNAQFGMFLSLGWAPRPLPVATLIGSVWIDLPSAVAVNTGLIGAIGESRTTLLIPNIRAIARSQFTFQSAVWSPVNGSGLLTNACDCLINY